MILAELSQKTSEALTITGVSALIGFAVSVFFIVALIKACGKKTRAWVVICCLSAVLSLAAFGVAGVYGFPEIQKMLLEADTVDKVLTSKSGRLMITVPRGWSTMPDLNEDADLGAGNLLREQYMVLITESKKELNMELEPFANLIVGEMMKTLTNGSQSEFKPLTIGSYSALRCRLTGKVDNIDIVYQHTSVDTGDTLTQILCWTLPGREAKTFPLFEEVAATFKVKGTVSPATPSAAPLQK